MELNRLSVKEKHEFLKFLSQDEVAAQGKVVLLGALQRANASQSIFSVQLLQEWLALDSSWNEDSWNFRINFPGTVGEQNWSVVMPLSLEAMCASSLNEQIKQINQQTGRC